MAATLLRTRRLAPVRRGDGRLNHDVDPVALRLGFERGTGVVELRVVPTGFGADAVVERLRVLCAVMQAWSLVAGV